MPGGNRPQAGRADR